MAAEMFRDVLQNSADPKNWSGSPGLGFLDIVHRQGAGMVDIDDAIASTTTILPGKLSLGEGMGGSRTLTLRNSASSPVTYDLSHIVAIGTGPSTFPPQSFWLPDTSVTFSPSGSVTVPAGGTRDRQRDDRCGSGRGRLPDRWSLRRLPGLHRSCGPDSVYRVPYTGYKGDYQAIVALPNAPVIGKQNAPFVECAADVRRLRPRTRSGRLRRADEVPNVLLHFDHQVRRFELQIVDAATGLPVHPVFSNYVERNFVARNESRPPAGGPYADSENVFAFPWDGTRMHDNGNGTPDHRKIVPDGSTRSSSRR